MFAAIFLKLVWKKIVIFPLTVYKKILIYRLFHFQSRLEMSFLKTYLFSEDFLSDISVWDELRGPKLRNVVVLNKLPLIPSFPVTLCNYFVTLGSCPPPHCNINPIPPVLGSFTLLGIGSPATETHQRFLKSPFQLLIFIYNITFTTNE